METFAQKIGERYTYWKSAFVPRKIDIQSVRKPPQEIRINYVDTHDIREENMIDLRNLNKIEILNYKREFHTTQRRSEQVYDPWQMCFFAMITPKAHKTVREIEGYWKCSYRQAMYIARYIKDFKSQKELALNYYMSLLKD